MIVLGAGPAGAAAAFHLAARGRSVQLIEPRSPEQGKPCGGGMAASVQRWFPFDLTPAVAPVMAMRMGGISLRTGLRMLMPR